MKPNFIKSIAIVLLFSTMCSIAQESIVVRNARIWTGNPKQPWAEALATKGDKIIFVGSNIAAEKYTSTAQQIIDAQGKMVTPGFIDSHVHFIMGGLDLISVQLRDVTSKEMFIQRIADYAKKLPAGEWIFSGTWDHTLWGGELPQAAWIDVVTPNNPVFIARLDGHMYLANSAAMKAAGINDATPDVEGGTIMRDEKRNPTGIFKDNAFSLIEKVVPPLSNATYDKALDIAMDYFAERGITSIHHMGTWEDLEIFRRAHQQGRLKTRIYANVPFNTWARLKDEIATKGKGDEWLQIGGLKGFVDGALGSHTAAMKLPYTDNRKDKGLFITPLDSIYNYVSNADKAGLQLMVHAIGDDAINKQLDIFQRVAKENGTRDRRFRIEHAQHIDPADMHRFAGLKVIPSMQPYHAIDDGRWAIKYIGALRAKTTYAFKSLIKNNARPAFGSDWFVAPPAPMEGIYAALTRRTLDNKNPQGWIPEQKITLEEALKAYTINSAYASFDDHRKGSIEVGKLADFVLLDADLTKVQPEKLQEVKVLKTVVGGKIVYGR